jgi:hypothetical protein
MDWGICAIFLLLAEEDVKFVVYIELRFYYIVRMRMSKVERPEHRYKSIASRYSRYSDCIA